MLLKSLTLANFKNIEDARLQFSGKFNCLLGDNGMGKSNLLDAIYFLSFCKSFSGVVDSMLIRRVNGAAPAASDFAMLQAQYVRHGIDEELAAGIQPGRRKSFKRGGKEYKKLSEHIGKFPLVLVSPADMDLVSGSGEERRRFMDMVISQTDVRYLDALIRYTRALEQRNRMLRDGVQDRNLFLAVELGMEQPALYLAQARRQWTCKLSEIFRKHYASIGGDGEEPSLAYSSHLADPNADFAALMDERRVRDAALKYTTGGPQRDDIEMTLSGMPLRRTASQGQAKSYTIALRLAQYEFLKESTGLSPILLLDDIFDKLDASRVEKIMAIVGSPTFGQIFITDTNRKHLDEILAHSAGDYAMWRVQNGCFDQQH